MIKKLLANKRWLWVAGLVAVVFVVVLWPRGQSKTGIVTVLRGTIVQEVQVTGQTKPSQNIQMSFDRAGRIASAPVRVGQSVVPGEVLATLDSSDLWADLNSALASVSVEEAKLSALRKGSRAEELAISTAKAENAKISLVQALHSAYQDADDAVRNLTDQLYDYPGSAIATLKFVAGNFHDSAGLSESRQQIGSDLVTWKKSDLALTEQTDLFAAHDQVSGYLTTIRNYLSALAVVVNSYVPDGINSSTVVGAYRTDLAAARTKVDSALSASLLARQALRTAQDELTLKKAAATAEDLTIQEAQVASAEARVAGIRAQIGKNTISSPISGTVTRQDARVGETAVAGVNLVTVMSDGGFEVEADVPEVDIGKIKLTDPVQITLDAFPGERWSGKVYYLEPAETIINSVVNYKIKIVFDANDLRLKSGLTANLVIETARREGALYLPLSAITETAGDWFALRMEADGQTKRLPLEIGLRGQDGRTEILSGLAEGEKVQAPGSGFLSN